MAFGAVLLLHLTGAAPAAGAGDEASPGAAKPPLALELNKLEEREGGAGCRVAMVFANRSPAEFDAFRLDLISSMPPA